MATRLFLRDLASSNAPTDGEKSAALPVGSFKGNSGPGYEDRSLETTPGAAGVTKRIVTLAQTAHQDLYIARFTSQPLSAQTIAANTWTLRLSVAESNGAANAFLVLSLYAWRPSTNSVVGYIYDSDTTIGAEWPTTETATTFTFSGSSLNVQGGDVLVVEVWAHAVQGMANPYTLTIGLNDADGTLRGSYLETPQNLSFQTQSTRARLSWTEFEVPFAPTRSRLSWTEFEVPFAPTRGRLSWTEFEVPIALTRARLSWAEFEAPFVLTRARLSWSEFEVPFIATRGRLSWTEFEVPIAPTRARLSWTEFEVPSAPGSPTRARLSWTEFEVPLVSTRGRLSWTEFEIPIAPTRGRLSWTEFEIPIALTRSRLSWMEFEVPIVPTRARLSWAEFEVLLAPTRARISWTEFEVPIASTRARLSWTEFEAPLAPTRARMSWAEFEVPVLGEILEGGLARYIASVFRSRKARGVV